MAFAALLRGLFLAASDRRGLWLPIGLLAGGAIGNLIDRIHEGAVTDFVDIGPWPAFNVADVEITLGVMILVWMFAFGPQPEAEPIAVEPGPEAARAGTGVALSPASARWSSGRTSYLAVVDKPAGLIVHPAPGNPGPIARRGPRRPARRRRGSGPAGHRPSARPDTSGLLVVAREPEAHKALSAMIAAREVTRRVRRSRRGLPAVADRKDRRAARPRSSSPERVVVGGRRPRPAVTHFEVRERLPREALLDVRLETGRTHQIRAHLQAIGNPIVGDPQYGSGGRYGLERQFLHSQRLAFEHPMGKGPLEFESELPCDLAAALEQARRP